MSAYALWGLFPLYFVATMPASPFEVVSYRVIFSLLVCVIAVSFIRQWKLVWSLIRTPRALLMLGAAALMIFINWEVFLIAVVNNQIVESSLGYFINPIVTVLLGVIVLREKMRRLQWVAVGISFIAVIVLTVSYGQVPWIALVLALTFGLYGLIKKNVGRNVPAIAGMTIETAWSFPIAIVQIIIVSQTVGLTFFGHGTAHTLLLAASGLVTVTPLALFAAGTARLPLTLIGLIQYFTPVTTFILGITVLGETMSPSRWVGFIIIWIALSVLSVDMILAARRNSKRKTAKKEEEPLATTDGAWD